MYLVLLLLSLVFTETGRVLPTKIRRLKLPRENPADMSIPPIKQNQDFA